MANEDPLWIARRDGQDWRDDDVQAAIDWLRGLAPAADIAARIEAQRQGLDAALAIWRDGGQAPPTDGQDPAAWWLLQGADFADGRRHSVPEEAARITPLLKRLGADLAILRGIPGAEDRAGRLLTERRTTMDAGVYELLVALAWRRDGWTVEFVPEQRGGPATADFLASRPNRRWAVECKRLDRSTYAINEAAHGTRLANPVHDLLRGAGPPLVVETLYNVELQDVPDGVGPERSDGLFKRDAGQLFDDGLVAVHRLEPSAGEKRTEHRTRRLRNRPGWTAARRRWHETAKDGETAAGVQGKILRLAVVEAHPHEHLLQLIPGRLAKRRAESGASEFGPRAT